jgi:hypothetical protein
MNKLPWTAEKIAFVLAHYPDHKTAWIAEQVGFTEKQVYERAKVLGVKKSHAFLSSAASGRMQREDHRGRAHQFGVGFTPWNKGRPHPSTGRAVETQFKPGQLPHNHNPIGHERLTRDGYTERKMTDTRVTKVDYVAVHRLVWMAAHGPVPKGCAICFKDGNPQNVAIENLELLTRAELMRRNTRHNLPPEVNQCIQLRIALLRKINHRMKQGAEA